MATKFTHLKSKTNRVTVLHTSDQIILKCISQQYFTKIYYVAQELYVF